MTDPRNDSKNVMPGQRYLEVLVPLLSFGATGIGIILWHQGMKLDYQYFSIGCILSSCILAYLAWIRPRRDIVALTTPVYAFIFFLVPSDDGSWIILQLLYAVSLTALLIRLKYRFGMDAPQPGKEEERGPLDEYTDRVAKILPEIPMATAGEAGSVFIRFSQGNFDAAFRLAQDALAGIPESSVNPLADALAVIAEQASHTEARITAPSAFHRFSPESEAFLFYPADPGRDAEKEYYVTLDNALLFLFAVTLAYADIGRQREIRSYRKYARSLATSKQL